MGTSMGENRFMSHRLPDIQDPTVERASWIGSEGEKGWVRSQEADRVEVVRVNGDFLRAQAS